MRFEPVYLADRVNPTSNGKGFAKNKLNVVNPEGDVGIVTLWTDPGKVWEKWSAERPGLFAEDSPVVAVGSLYGNGLPQMLANLAANPQINRLVVTGTDTKVVPSSQYLLRFLAGEFEGVEFGGIRMNRINGTSFHMDAQLTSGMFSHLRAERFKIGELERVVNFASGGSSQSLGGGDRVYVELREPKFDDRPSDVTNHNIVAPTSFEAWMEVMHRIDRYGENVELGRKGSRRTLWNLDVNVLNPEKEVGRVAAEFGFSDGTAAEYVDQILSREIPGDSNYGYGHRMRTYWGGDALDSIAEGFRRDEQNRYGFLSLWDTKEDLVEGESHPCLTDVYFANQGGRLMLSAGFRTHNASSAYLYNLLALRALQEHVAQGAEMEPGQINVRSRIISIDPADSSVESKLALIDKKRKSRLDINDPVGYFVPEVDKVADEIRLHHYSPGDVLLQTYSGGSALVIKDALRRDVPVLRPDHGVWLGYGLARAEFELKGEIPEL